MSKQLRSKRSIPAEAIVEHSNRTKNSGPCKSLTEKLRLAIENRARFTEDGDHLQAIREALTDICYEVVGKVTYSADPTARGLRFRNRITGWEAEATTTNFIGTFTDLQFFKP
jgi:hypothetical protein